MATDVLVATGHRPPKLGGYEWVVLDALQRLATKVLEHHEPFTVVSGMAIGWDQAIAKAAMDLTIPYVAVVPFEGYEGRWPPETQKLYRKMLDQAQAVEVFDRRPGSYLGKQEAVAALMKRNEALLSYAQGVPDHVIAALWNGETAGGTFYTVRAAEKLGLRVVNYYASWLKHGPGISEEEGKRRAEQRRQERMQNKSFKYRHREYGYRVGDRN